MEPMLAHEIDNNNEWSVQVMKIAITGANGRIGKVLYSGLMRDDRFIRGIDLKGEPEQKSSNEMVFGDLKNMEFAVEALADIDVLVHLAAIAEERPWEEIFPNNFEITYNVFEAAKRVGI